MKYSVCTHRHPSRVGRHRRRPIGSVGRPPRLTAERARRVARSEKYSLTRSSGQRERRTPRSVRYRRIWRVVPSVKGVCTATDIQHGLQRPADTGPRHEMIRMHSTVQRARHVASVGAVEADMLHQICASGIQLDATLSNLLWFARPRLPQTCSRASYGVETETHVRL